MRYVDYFKQTHGSVPTNVEVLSATRQFSARYHEYRKKLAEHLRRVDVTTVPKHASLLTASDTRKIYRQTNTDTEVTSQKEDFLRHKLTIKVAVITLECWLTFICAI